MLDKITIGKYYPGKSRIHFLSPLAKIISLFCFILMVTLCFDLKLSILFFLLICLVIGISNIDSKIYIQTLFNLKWFILILVLFNVTFDFDLEILCLSIIRLLSIALYMTILTLTTTPLELITGFKKFLKPLRIFHINTNKLALTFSLALRFIPIMIEQKKKVLKSQASRGVDYYNSSLKNKFIAFKKSLKPILQLTLNRAEQIAHSMDVRLFDINANRSSFRIHKWTLTDTFFVLVHVTLLLAVIGNEFIW